MNLVSREKAIDVAIDEYNRGYKEGLKAASLKWVPCSERLPEKENEEQRRNWYLTTNAYGNVSLTKYEFDGDFGFIGWGTHRPADIRIIAWMPLPESYKGVNE